MIKKFLNNSYNIVRDSIIWNMMGSLIVSLQSVIMLVILTRTVGLIESGIFTIAYANANVILNFGKYGMRNYQVSDVTAKYSFRQYLASRKICVYAMLIASIVYVTCAGFLNSYSVEKSMIIFWMCLFKMPDAIEDIYHGEYQKQGRLDIASKAMTIRLLFTTILFGVCVVMTRKLLLSLIVSTIGSFIVLWLFILWTYEPEKYQVEDKKTCNEKAMTILKQTFPLFAGSFMSFYIGNAPRYAIDRYLSDELQACYGFVAMPVFVVGVLNGFIFNPMLHSISCLWNERKYREFAKKIGIQILIVIGITVGCLIGAWILGIPVLSILYSTDLKPYKDVLMIMLLGGGFLGLSGLLNAVITILRCQKSLVWAYLFVSILAIICSNMAVKSNGILGAAVLYAILMGALCVCFFFIILLAVRKEKNRIRLER